MHSRHLGNLLLESTRHFKKKPLLAFMQDDRLTQVSFNQFLDEVKNWASFLQTSGVSEGDRVAFITPKSPNQIRAFYACWWIGAVAVPISETLADLEIGFIIRDCDPTVILVDTSLLERIKADTPDTPVIAFTDIPGNIGKDKTPDLNLTPDTANAAIIYTSGSTGMPKGVVLSHRNFYVNTTCVMETFHIHHKETIASLLPYWHCLALVGEVILPVMAGLRVVIPRDKRDFVTNLHIFKPTILLVVPRIAETMMAGITKKINSTPPRLQKLFNIALKNAERASNPNGRIISTTCARLLHKTIFSPLLFRTIRSRFGGKLKFIVSGGAPLGMRPQLFFNAINIPILQGYGLTEASPVISVNTHESNKPGSCGPMLPWLRPENDGDFTFQDEHGNTGKNLTGELLVRGDCVMQGYWRHADSSAKTLRDGWLHTGDTGYLDPDGNLFLDGRLGNMIVLVGGEKIHPEHVEEAIITSDLISAAMVIGDNCKNVYACVCLDPDQAKSIPADQQQTRARDEVLAVTRHLAPFQRPKDILILPPFTIEDGTLTVTLKIKRNQIREKYGDRIRTFLEQCNGESPKEHNHD